MWARWSKAQGAHKRHIAILGAVIRKNEFQNQIRRRFSVLFCRRVPVVFAILCLYQKYSCFALMSGFSTRRDICSSLLLDLAFCHGRIEIEIQNKPDCSETAVNSVKVQLHTFVIS